MSGVSDRVSFTVYDVISSFLPGAIFTIGALFPFIGPNGLLIKLELGSIFIFIIISFTIGLSFQAIGGIVSSTSTIFTDHLRDVVADEENDTSPLDVDASDVQFVEAFRREFDLDSDFSNWDSLYRRVISRLERSGYRRTIRLQALQLGTRGLSVAMVMLFFYYIIGLLLILTSLSIEKISSEVPAVLISILATIYFALSIVFYKRSNTYGRYTVRYMISEFLELTESNSH